jgi:predicted RNase H-like HicB family nuclease
VCPSCIGAAAGSLLLPLPGVFASGDTVDELLDSLKEAVALYLGDGENSATELSELKLAVTA